MAAKKTTPLDPVILAAVKAARDLEALNVRYALVGGLAVSARGEPRYTRDVDFAIFVERDAEAEALVHSLSTRGYEIVTVIEQRRAKRLATARLRRADDRSVLIDLLFASSGIEREVALEADRVEIDDDVDVDVASVGHLIAMKVLSEREARPYDRADIQELAKVATPEDWKTADAMVRLIKARGYHRGRALITRLRRFRRAHGG